MKVITTGVAAIPEKISANTAIIKEMVFWECAD